MAHVIPAMRIAALTPRVAPTVLRKSDAPRSSNTSASINSNLAAAASSAAVTSNPAADFRALFTARSNPPVASAAPAAPVTPASTAAPTAESLFGPNPWMANPGGVAPNGVTYGYNPYYFATAETAAKVAQMVGGTVVQSNAITPYGPFQQNQPNYMVQLPNGRQIYAGLVASFYDHGYTQDFVNRLVDAEVKDTGA